MSKPHVKLDNRPIKEIEWVKYNKRYEAWRDQYKGRLNTMEAAMMEPNKPNYFRANND